MADKAKTRTIAFMKLYDVLVSELSVNAENYVHQNLFLGVTFVEDMHLFYFVLIDARKKPFFARIFVADGEEIHDISDRHFSDRGVNL